MAGTSKTFSKVDGDEVPRPDGAVETWEEDCHQSSPLSSAVYRYRLLWHDAAVPEQDRIALRQKFSVPFMRTPKEFT